MMESDTLHDEQDVAPLELQEESTSTGTLPEKDQIEKLLEEAHARYAADTSGEVAQYIPALAEADPDQFGLCLVGVESGMHSVGDVDAVFSIQSISKAFVFALVAEVVGHETVRDVVGLNNTGLSFNSVMAIELNTGSPMNPMVNAGAMATTALVPGETAEEKWQTIEQTLSKFAGRDLAIDQEVYESESMTNDRNRAIARLLYSYSSITEDPNEVLDLYTRQCALAVTVQDVALMGATLAGGGVNPKTGERVVGGQACRDTLAALAASGMYERSGDWLYEIGVPGKSGVSGGLVAIAPGKGALGSFSPRLDSASMSVRGQRAAHFLSGALGLNMFASMPSDVAPAWG